MNAAPRKANCKRLIFRKSVPRRRLRDAGKYQEALTEFQKAAEIDASSFIAQQEVRRTQKMIDAAAQAPAPRAVNPADTLDKRLEGAKGPVELAAIANVPITLKVTDDSKRIYETVGKLAGINVLFDPDYTSRRIPIELNGVTLEEAMGVIALESKTFWRPVTQTRFLSLPTIPPNGVSWNRTF